jgi:phosphoglycerate dehydrogenase-like enzyme
MLMRCRDQARKWAPYDVEELRRRTFGVVGYGDIGQACARLAKAFRMRVVALRRRTTLTEAEKQENVLVGAPSACLKDVLCSG